MVATALFGDGAAAAVVTSGEHSLARITGSAEKLWPDTLRIMGWDVEDPGLAVVFDRAIPPFIEAELAEAVDEMCAELGIARAEIDRFCCHPGGVKVIDAIETALELNQGELNLEREVLRDYGNMSAPTVMFVLERLLEQGLPEQGHDDRLRPRLHLRRTAARSRVIARHRHPRARHAAAPGELWLSAQRGVAAQARMAPHHPTRRLRSEPSGARERRPAIIR